MTPPISKQFLLSSIQTSAGQAPRRVYFWVELSTSITQMASGQSGRCLCLE